MISKASDMGPSGGEKGSERRLDFVIGIANMTWPGLAAVTSGFANLTAAGMRTTDVLNKSMNTLNAGMLAAGGAAALALGLMTAEAAKFEKQMKVVQSLIQDVNDSPLTIQTKMAEMTKTAKELAIAYGMSPVKVAEGLAVLGRAGISTTKEMNTVMEASVQLAKIEGIAVQDAATMTIQMTTLFGGNMARDATKFAEILAHAANVSTTSAKEIMTGMQYAGGIAASVWGSSTIAGKYENASQMAAMIASLSQQGVSGPMAGTAIKSFVNYMVKGMPKSKKALAELGLTTEDLMHADKTYLTLPEIMDLYTSRFQEKFYDPDAPNQINPGQMYKWFVRWGEPRQAQQYVKMIATNPETGLHYIDEYIDKMHEEYDMQQKVNTVMSSASEKFNKAISGIQVFAVNVGEKFLPVLGAIADFFSFIASQAGLSDLLAWITALGLLGFVMLGLKAVVGWLVPAFGDMRTMLGHLSKGQFKQAFGFGATTAGLEGETAALVKDTLALETNTIAREKNAASIMGVVTPAGNKADIARRTKTTQAALAGSAIATGAPYGTPSQIRKESSVIRGAGAELKASMVAENAMITGLIAQNAALETKSNKLGVQKRKTLGAWEKAFGQKSLVGGRTAAEARALMTGANLADPMAWAMMFGGADSMYLANKARGKAVPASILGKMGASKVSFLDGIFAAAMAENIYATNTDKMYLGQKNALNRKKALIADEITANRKHIAELKTSAREKGLILEELKKIEGTPLGGVYGGATQTSKAEQSAARRLMASEGMFMAGSAGMIPTPMGRARALNERTLNRLLEEQFAALGFTPGGGVVGAVNEGKKAEEVIAKSKVKIATAKTAAKMSKMEGLVFAGMAGSIPLEALQDSGRKARLLRQLEKVKGLANKEKMLASLGAAGGIGSTAALALGVGGIIAAIAGLGIYQYGNAKNRRWWTPTSQLEEEVRDDQTRHLQYLRKEYQAAITTQKTLQALKQKGYDVEARNIIAKNRAEALGGVDGTGGLIKQYQEYYESANLYTKTLKNTQDYYLTYAKTKSQELMTPPVVPSTDVPYGNEVYGATATGNIAQRALNEKYRNFDLAMKPYTEEMGVWYNARKYAGLVGDRTWKARGEFAGTAGGTYLMAEWGEEQDKLAKFEKAQQENDVWGMITNLGASFTPGTTELRSQTRLKQYSGKYLALKDKINKKEATPEDIKTYRALTEGYYVGSAGEAYQAAGAWGSLWYTLQGGDYFSSHLQESEKENILADRGLFKKRDTDKNVTQQNAINVKTINVYGADGTPEETSSALTDSLVKVCGIVFGGQ